MLWFSYDMDPFANALYLFCGRRCDRIKALHFDKLSEAFCYPHIFKRIAYVLYIV
ncbi:MAG: IS66 family insertion sequence element accessory protein TnpB [Lachnospiraceae bacterium]|nr:IS66 family insertion sequence element accessory protein TnpB [Lachnospiraceae bacterium]